MQGSNRVRNQLRTWAAKNPEITDPVIRAHANNERIILKATPYPARRPNQRYRRTGRLANSFAVERIKKASYAVINTRPGAGWVIKKGFQNREFHVNRWWTMEDEMAKRMPMLTQDLSEAIEDEWRRVPD